MVPVWRFLRSDEMTDWTRAKVSLASEILRVEDVVFGRDRRRSIFDFISSRDWIVSRITSSKVNSFNIIAYEHVVCNYISSPTFPKTLDSGSVGTGIG